MFEFEQAIAYLNRQGIKKKSDWQAKHPDKKYIPEPVFMEVEDSFLTDLNNGTYPPCHYVIWNNVRVCAHGKAADIAKEEGKTIHEVVFKNESQYKLSTVLNK